MTSSVLGFLAEPSCGDLTDEHGTRQPVRFEAWLAITSLAFVWLLMGCTDTGKDVSSVSKQAPTQDRNAPVIPRLPSATIPSPDSALPPPAASNSPSESAPLATPPADPAQWQRLSAVTRSADAFESVETNSRTGVLTILPRSNSWYQAFRGGLLFQDVEGDFAIHATLHVSGRGDRLTPQTAYSLAGLLVRSPDNTVGAENFVFHAIGATDATDRFQFQHMATRNGQSQFERRDAAGGRAELLLARIRDSLWLLSRTKGKEWVEHARLHRPDLPSRVQVGLAATTDWRNCEAVGSPAHNTTGVSGGGPDLIARFESIQLRSLPATVPSQLAEGDAVDPAKLVAALAAVVPASPQSALAMPALPVQVVPSPPASQAVDQPQPTDDLAELSDEFKDPSSISKWLRVFEVEQTGADQLKRFDIDRTTRGWMTLVPHTSTWFRDWRGELVHKRVRGDFVATTHLRATKRSGKGAPNAPFSLAGIMLRTPRDVTPRTWQPGGENYVFLSLGTADRPGSHQLEVKTTINSDSKLEINNADGPEALLRAARIGSHIILLRKPATGGQWVVHRRYHRSDMPNELQVGITVYTDWQNAERLTPQQHNRTVIRNGNPDLRASFNYFRFGRPQVPNELQGKALSDPHQVSDQQLLDFLGFDDVPQKATASRKVESAIGADPSPPQPIAVAPIPASEKRKEETELFLDGFFPIGVFSQPADSFAKWKKRGVNTILETPMKHDPVAWDNAAQLEGLRVIRRPLPDPRTDIGRKDLLAWSHWDEPDAAGRIAEWTPQFQKTAAEWRTVDPTRRIFINFAGPDLSFFCSQKDAYSVKYASHYPALIATADWVANDLYPCGGWLNRIHEPRRGEITLIAEPIKLIKKLTDKPQFAFIETSEIELGKVPGARCPTADEVRAEIWEVIIHGVRGFFYFPAVVGTNGFNFDGTPPEIVSEITKQNETVTQLARVLQGRVNPPEIGATVAAPLEAGWRHAPDASYFFVLNTKSQALQAATVGLKGVSDASSATVFSESRSVSLANGKLTDDFGPHAVHIYIVQRKQ